MTNEQEKDGRITEGHAMPTGNALNPRVYVLDEEQLAKLGAICSRLHAGSDAMRDEGHRLWLVLKAIS